jgi:hypothetical protein
MNDFPSPLNDDVTSMVGLFELITKYNSEIASQNSHLFGNYGS